jgi:hypothetical protein
MLLHRFGFWLRQAFPHTYHVGSSVMSKDGWRDVDVRVIVSDDEYRAMFPDAALTWDPPTGANPKRDARWSLICTAISLMGQQMTGLPIDFQIQSESEAATESGPRSAIGIVIDTAAPSVGAVSDTPSGVAAASEEPKPLSDDRDDPSCPYCNDTGLAGGTGPGACGFCEQRRPPAPRSEDTP